VNPKWKHFFLRPTGIGTGLNVYMLHPSRIVYAVRLLFTEPIFFIARIRNIIYQLLHPDRPWLTQEAVAFLIDYLTKNMIGFEWGSGRSTLWFAKRCGHLVSVEDNQSWHSSVQQMLGTRPNVDYRYVSTIGTCDNYAAAIEDFPDSHFDFIIIDGSCRDRCIILALPKVKRGGIIVVDNMEQGFNTSPLSGLKKITTDNGVWRTDIYVNT
jgi:hypothetical protein